MTSSARPAVGGLLQRTSQAIQRQWWQTPPTPQAQALRLLAGLYAQVAHWRRRLIRPQQVGLPVVVVGNLIAGGAGKTPTTIAVVRLLRAFGWHPGVVSRGHGRRSSGVVAVSRDSRAADCGDEPLLIRLRTGMPVMVASDRVAAAKALRAAHPEVDIIVADDGLQHHRLARDLQIIVFDERGAGNRLLLPAGPLREPMPAQAPAATLVLYNAPQVNTPLSGWMATRRLAGVLPLAEWWRGQLPAPDSWRALHGLPLVAAAGMAVPERFFAMLEAQGLSLAQRLALPDHFAYEHLPWPDASADVIVTEKDAVKLRPDAPEFAGARSTRIWVAPLDFEPEVAFAAALKRHFPHPPKF
jgi:tetraacyldisaccharide 4'-kinase